MYISTSRIIKRGTPIPTTQPITILRFFLDKPEWFEPFSEDAEAVGEYVIVV